MSSRPTITSLVSDLVSDWDHETDPEIWASENVEGVVSPMTTTLFQMVVDDNSLAFLDGPEVTTEPFSCLYGAICQEVVAKTVEAIQEIILGELEAIDQGG